MGWKNPLTGSLKSSDSGALRKIFQSLEDKIKVIDDALGTASAWRQDEPGVVKDFAGSTTPTGYLFCYGQAVSRTTYAALFAAIGTSWGVGDGSTTFNVPDLRGRVGVGLDDMGGVDAGRLTVANTLGGTGGAQTHVLLTAEMPSHTHTQNSHTHVVYGADASAGGTNGFGFGDMAAASSTRNQTSAGRVATNQNTGGGGAHNNMQPYALLNKIIKT